MRKHFLILMLLTLLPFTAWADDIANVKLMKALPTVYSTTATDFAVTDFNKDYVDADDQGEELTAGELTLTLKYLANYDGSTEPVDWTAATSPASVTNAGWYKLTVANGTSHPTSWADDSAGEYIFFVAKQAIDNVTVIYTAPTVYTGENQNPIVAVKTGEEDVPAAAYSMSWKYLNVHVAPTDWSAATIPANVTNAGWYQLTVAATSNYTLTFTDASNVTDFEVAKANNDLGLARAGWAWEATATAHPVTVAPAFGNAADVVVTYREVNTTGAWLDWPVDDKINDIANYDLKATLATPDADNVNAAEETIQFSVTRANIDLENDVDEAPAAVGPTFDGTAKALHTLGTWTNDYGTFQFATSADAPEEAWSEEAITGINAVGYTVYYRIIGDAHHNNVAPTLIANTKINPIELEVAATTLTRPYTGTAVAVKDLFNITDGALIEADNTDAMKNSLVTVAWTGAESQPTAANTAGHPYTLTAGTPMNYKVTVVAENGLLIITKAALTAKVNKINGSTAATGGDYVYGDRSYADPSTSFETIYLNGTTPVSVTPTTLTYEVKTAGDVDYYTRNTTTDAITGVKGDVGTYVVTPTAVFDNYEVTAVQTKSFTVSQAELNKDWISLSASEFDYDGHEHMPTVTVTNGLTQKYGKNTLVEGVDYALTEPDDKTNAGEKPITINAMGNFKNPTVSSVLTPSTKNYTINKIPLTIVVKNKQKDWDGIEIADVTATKTTLDNYATIYNDLNEDYDEVFKKDAGVDYPEFEVVKKQVGTDPVTGDPIMDNTYAGVYVYKAKGYTARNYDVMVSNGTFTIGAPSITIKAKNTSKKYGDADPTSFDYEVYVGDDVDPVAANLRSQYVKTAPTSITRANATQQTVGEYTITCSEDAVLEDNYATATLTYETGIFTIEKAQLRILADAKTKVYDGVEPIQSENNAASDVNLTYTAIGLKYTDAVSSVKLVKAAGTDVEKYDITASDAVVTNASQYDIKYQKAKYEITKRALTKIDILGQSITKQDGNTETDKENAIETLDKTKVNFTADGYTLTDADKQKLQSEFDFVFAGAVNVSVANTTGITNAIKIKFHDGTAKFTNFSLPTTGTPATEIDLNGAAVDNKYELGTLKIFAPVVGDVAFDDSETDEDKTVSKLIETYAGQNLPSVKVILNRNQVLGTTNCNWAAEKWNTMVLPFDVTVRELSAELGYAIVNVVDKANTTASNVAFKLQMSGTIPANTPFVVKTDVAIPNETELSFTNKTIVDASASVDAGCGYEFVGVYETKKLGGGTAIDDSKLSFLRGNGDKWGHIGAGSTNSWNIVPMAAYVDLTPATDAREVTFTMQEADGSTTVIRNITGEAAAKLNAEGWYTINGIKLDNAPVEKGVYIHNGKKVVLK